MKFIFWMKHVLLFTVSSATAALFAGSLFKLGPHWCLYNQIQARPGSASHKELPFWGDEATQEP